MNPSTIGGIVRTLLACVAGYAAGKGLDLTGLSSPEVTNGIGLVLVAIWSVFSKKPAKPLDN